MDKEELAVIGITAVLGGVVNGSLTFLSGEGVSFDRASPKNNSWALQPTIPVPRFSADYQTPKLATIAYATAVGSFAAGGLIWFILQSIKWEQQQLERQLRVRPDHLSTKRASGQHRSGGLPGERRDLGAAAVGDARRRHRAEGAAVTRRVTALADGTARATATASPRATSRGATRALIGENLVRAVTARETQQ